LEHGTHTRSRTSASSVEPRTNRQKRSPAKCPPAKRPSGGGP
jgi:hypothetical protein